MNLRIFLFLCLIASNHLKSSGNYLYRLFNSQ
jgi:hypothetical protein